ncbi:MAG: hypothetical protein ACLFPJ_02155 [Candidatus Woesearchaeota archaeon]
MSLDLLLGVLYPNDKKKNESIKRVLPEEYYGIEVSNFVERMLDSEPDFYNPTKYTEDEEELCDKAIENINFYQNRNDTQMIIKANTNENSEYYPEKINLNIKDELCEYTGDIVQQKTMKLPNGEEKYVSVIEMYINFDATGGAKKNYK